MNRRRMHSIPVQLVGKPVGAKFRGRKYKNLLEFAGLHEITQQFAFFLARNRNGDVLHRIGGGIAASHLHHDRIIQEGV